jgi:hypothetical protein
MSSEASMTQPTENIPTDHPVWHSHSEFSLGAKRPMAIRTSRIGTLHQLADQMERALEAEKVAMAIGADVHPTPARTTPRVLHLQDHIRPSQIL